MGEHDLGTGMEPAVPDRRRGGWRVTILGALIAVVVLGGGLFVLHARGDGNLVGPVLTAKVALPSPKAIERDGVTFHVQRAAGVAAAPDPDDPTVVILYAGDVYEPENPKCSFMEPTARVESQSGNEVRIATFDYGMPPKKTGSMSCGYSEVFDPEATVPSGFAALRLHLDAPWDGRPLVDIATGKGIARVADLVRPEPGYLPAGFREHTGPEGMEEPDPSAMANMFTVGRNYGRGNSTLEVTAQSESYAMYTGEPVGHDDVGGVRATLTEADYQRCVEWSPRHGVKVAACSGGEEPRLSAAELLRVARGLELPPSA